MYQSCCDLIWKSKMPHNFWTRSVNSGLSGYVILSDQDWGQNWFQKGFGSIVELMDNAKGQLISKGLVGILEFFQKTNQRIRSGTVGQKNEFVCSFLEE